MPGCRLRYWFILSSGNHDCDVELIPVPDRPGQPLGMGALPVNVDIDLVVQLTSFKEEPGLDLGELHNQVVEALSDCAAVDHSCCPVAGEPA